MSNYLEFLTTKRIKFKSSGIKVEPSQVHSMLFPFQRDLVIWALAKGKAALFADTGLGKTFMSLEWARLLGKRTLIIAPLSVAQQTIREAKKIDIEVKYVRGQIEVGEGQIFITNYEMIKAFDASKFEAVVLDESSILKSLDGKTKAKLIEMFSTTPYRLCCTATPAPNDIVEIANHSEFLGILSVEDMKANFFVHDDKGWRLRGYAEEKFYIWLASWGMSIRYPSDLGYDDAGFDLPPLNINPIIVETGYVPEGQLCFTGLKGIQDRQKVRRMTLSQRVEVIAEKVNNSNEQWLIWCGLNNESTELYRAIEDAVEVKGNDPLETKIKHIENFVRGHNRVLVTKTKIAGFGMNFQNCHNMAFVGLSDSFEAYYQAVRRCYRFGQENEVNVYIVLGDVEQEILSNIKRKERQASEMSRRLIENVQQFEVEELELQDKTNGWEYEKQEVVGENYKLMLGDSVERLKELGSNSIDFSVFSPPFMDLYTYSPTERDLGNSASQGDFFKHFGYIIDELLRVIKPGRICAVHTADIPALLSKDGYIGLKDFPGKVIKAYEERGWIYHGRVTIDKNPQAQAIRTKAKALLFRQLEKDSSWSRPAIGDYILMFRKPGDNTVPIMPVENGEITREKWIEWAHPIWYGIIESDTLQYTTARGADDDKHICPLQLGTIERCITLWSNPGETVLSPFAGIGSEVYKAVQMGRRGIGIELKQGYFNVMVKNLAEVERAANEVNFFDLVDAAQSHNGKEIEIVAEVPPDQYLKQIGSPALPGFE